MNPRICKLRLKACSLGLTDCHANSEVWTLGLEPTRLWSSLKGDESTISVPSLLFFCSWVHYFYAGNHAVLAKLLAQKLLRYLHSCMRIHTVYLQIATQKEPYLHYLHACIYALNAHMHTCTHACRETTPVFQQHSSTGNPLPRTCCT